MLSAIMTAPLRGMGEHTVSGQAGFVCGGVSMVCGVHGTQYRRGLQARRAWEGALSAPWAAGYSCSPGISSSPSTF